MFKKEDKLQNRIDDLLDEMEMTTGDSPEYSRMADQLTKLYDAQDKSKSSGITKEALIGVAGNLAGILIIVNHERAHVITSKAFGFLSKIRN